MNLLVTTAIILSRTNYGEADRILTVLTPQYGKLRLMAKGVRRVKSKLAGGIELFSVSELTFIKGKGDIGTVVSTRLGKFYAQISKNLERTMLGYDLIKQLNKNTEDEVDTEYFELLVQAFEALNDDSIPLSLIRFWFAAQLLHLAGHMPNLQSDTTGKALQAAETYGFDFDSMSFAPSPRGNFAADHIKFLRLTFAGNRPDILAHVTGHGELVLRLAPLVTTMVQSQLRD